MDQGKQENQKADAFKIPEPVVEKEEEVQAPVKNKSDDDAWKKGASFIDLKHLGKGKDADKPSYLQKSDKPSYIKEGA
jgi:hypothetical protein